MRNTKRDLRVRKDVFLAVFSGVLVFVAVILVLTLLTGAGYLPKEKVTYTVGYQIPNDDGGYGNFYYRGLVQVSRAVESEKLDEEIKRLIEEKTGLENVYIAGYEPAPRVDSVYPR